MLTHEDYPRTVERGTAKIRFRLVGRVIPYVQDDQQQYRRVVLLNDQDLTPARSAKHQPYAGREFVWGDPAGNAQLSLAVLLELIGEEEAASLQTEFAAKFLGSLRAENHFEMIGTLLIRDGVLMNH